VCVKDSVTLTKEAIEKILRKNKITKTSKEVNQMVIRLTIMVTFSLVLIYKFWLIYRDLSQFLSANLLRLMSSSFSLQQYLKHVCFAERRQFLRNELTRFTRFTSYILSWANAISHSLFFICVLAQLNRCTCSWKFAKFWLISSDPSQVFLGELVKIDVIRFFIIIRMAGVYQRDFSFEEMS